MTPPTSHKPLTNSPTMPISQLLEQLIALVTQELEHDQSSHTGSIMEDAVLGLQRAMREIEQRDHLLSSLTLQSEKLAKAQADAIVHSAEIIDELERTKQNLADARLAAEDAAEDTQRLADTIFERTHDGVLVFEGLECIACNDNTLALLGCQRDDVLGKWPVVFETATFEDQRPANEAFQAAFGAAHQQTNTALEVQLPQSSRGSFWAEVTISTFQMKARPHVLMVVRDVTARKQFEVQLRRHRDFLNNIINTVPDPLSVQTSDQKLVMANEAFCQVYGYQREQILNQCADELLSTSDLNPCRPSSEVLPECEQAGATEQRFLDASGSQRIASVKQSVFSDKVTGRNYVVSTSRDITEDRRREEQLELLASVFETATEGAVILGSHGQVIQANPAFLKILNVPTLDHVRHQPLVNVFPGGLPELSTAIAKVLSGQPWSGKISTSKDNRIVSSFWLTLSPSHFQKENVSRVVALFSDITELEKSQAEIQHRALHDPLTDLPNRAYFRELLERKVKQFEELTVCFLDLDDFKHVNDSAGHAAGDELLRQVSKRIHSVIPTDSVLARFGGDEFALILYNRTQDQSLQLVEELCERFRTPFQVGETSAVVGLSVGITHYPQHALDVDSLLQTADIAMYAAKTAGKNRVRLFESSLQDVVNLRHRVQTKLQDALNDGAISLHYQPKYCAQTLQLLGCESLVRWRNAAGNYIPPSQFIPIAEQTGLIGPLGDLVFQLAAEQACRWSKANLPHRIAVNVSPHQLRHPRFMSEVARTLALTGAKPDWFELEITEHAMMEDLELSIGVINQLSSLGFHIAVDDFGTGYSSLSYLKNFQIHTLKIDISFVREVATDPYSEAIVRSIISLGKGLGLTLVAEGVENQQQADILTQMGCDILQGFLLGHPVDAEKFQQLYLP